MNPVVWINRAIPNFVLGRFAFSQGILSLTNPDDAFAFEYLLEDLGQPYRSYIVKLENETPISYPEESILRKALRLGEFDTSDAKAAARANLGVTEIFTDVYSKIGQVGERPIITSGAVYSAAENSTFNISLTANKNVTWLLLGGADISRFTVAGNTLTLPAKDFENPIDVDANNEYVVTIVARDVNLVDSLPQTIRVTITNINEAPNLNQLTILSNVFELGIPLVRAVLNTTLGSLLASVGFAAGFTLNTNARQIEWSGLGTIGTPTLTIDETLNDSANSPRRTNIPTIVQASQGPVRPTYAPSTPVYRSNFSAVADNTPLYTLSPWQAINRSGQNNLAQKSDAVIRQPEAYIHANRSFINSFDPDEVGQYLYGIDAGSPRHVIIARVFSSGQHKLSVSAIHNGSRTDVRLDNGAAGFDWSGAVGAETRTGRVLNYTSLYSAATARLVEGRGILSQPDLNSKIRIKSFDGKVKIAINGAQFADFTNTSAGNFVGFSSASNNYRGHIDIDVGRSTTDLTIDNPKGFYNRIVAYKGWANGGRRVTFTGTWSGRKPDGFIWGLVRPTDGTVIKTPFGVDYALTVVTRLFGTDLDGVGTYAVSIDIECGLDGENPYRLRLMPRNDSIVPANANLDTCDFDAVDSIGYFDISVGFVDAGQSERAGANSTIVAPGFPSFTGGRFCGIQDVANPPYVEQPRPECTPWGRDTAGEISSRARQSAWFTRHMSKAYGLPVSLTIVALGARLSQELGPNATGNDWNNIKAHLGYIGAFEHLIIGQGSAEANAGGAASWTTNWAANILAYFAYANQLVSHVPYVFMQPTGFGNIPGQVGTAAQNGNANSIRQQQADFPAYMLARLTPYNVVLACSATDLSYDAGGEFTDGMRSGGECSRRIAMTAAKTLGKTSGGLGLISGKGPFVTTLQKISNTLLRATVNLNGSTGISGNNLLGHFCYADAAGTTPIAITGPVNCVNATQFEIPVASTPGAVYWANQRDFSPPVNGQAIGAYANLNDGTPNGGSLTIPMYPVPVPMLAA